MFNPNSQQANAVWQQILALDARYSAYRTTNYPAFRTQYIRRRSQLLRENAKLHNDAEIRKRYLAIRAQLLAERYGVAPSDGSTRSRSMSLRSNSQLTVEADEISLGGLDRPSPSGNTVVPTSVADASRALVGDTSLAENYSFQGVHHVFDDHKGPITRLRFANDERDRLAVADAAGLVCLCLIATQADQSTVVMKFIGHEQAVTDICWSISNDLLVSCALDGTVRVWNTVSGECIRVVDDPQPLTCCIFQPLNNNLVVYGNQRGLVQVLNISTGKQIKTGACKTNGACTCMCADPSGRLLWVGDSTGQVSAFVMELASGKLVRAKRTLVCQSRPITSLSARAWLSREARDLCVLVSVAANMLCLYRANPTDGALQFHRKFPVKHSEQFYVRSNFCPLMSFRQGACVLSGSEDGCVYLFDVERVESKCCLNKLQAHSGVCSDVAFNHDESFLASGDMQGVVIIWKRGTPDKRRLQPM